jgi:TonB-dependent SusC/RagA subfamily outer membrane receptor
MKPTNITLILVSCILIMPLFWSACVSTEATSAGHSDAYNTRGVYQSLADYLRRSPKLMVVGSGENIQVLLRGIGTVSKDIEPLFVIDGTPAGSSYVQATRLVDVNDIQSVEVLTVAEASSFYGMRGSKGAVVIRTKTGQ